MSIYLDNNATTHLSPQVKNRLHQVISEDPGNPESPHSDGESARAIVENCRLGIADSINAQDNQIVFTGSGSESNSFVIHYLLEITRKTSELRVLTSELEHSSLKSGFTALEAEGAEIVRVPITPNGVVDVESIEKEAKFGVVAFIFQWANSVTGVLQPIGYISTIASDLGAYLHVDAAQAYGRIPIDVDDFLFDSLTFTAHKVHGPKGVAALFLRKPRNFQANIFGGQQEQHLRGGTHNVLGISGFDAAVQARFTELSERTFYLQVMRDLLESQIEQAIPEITIQGSDERRVPNTSCITFPGVDGLAFMAELDRKGVICSQTSACRSQQPEPSPALTAMGLSVEDAYATIRFSVSELNTTDEIESAVEIISSVYKTQINKKRLTV